MEKKSSPDKASGSVQEYRPVQFDEVPVNKIATEKQEISEEDIQTRLKALEKQAGEKGYDAGYKNGTQAGEQAVAEQISRLGGIIKGIEDFKEKKIKELRPDIVDLALDIARKIISKEIELDKNIVMYIVQDALKKVEEDEEKIIIKVNPQDYEVMISNIEFLKEESGVKNIIVEPSSSISTGGCYIETSTGEIDARLEEKIKEVEDVIGTAADREM